MGGSKKAVHLARLLCGVAQLRCDDANRAITRRTFRRIGSRCSRNSKWKLELVWQLRPVSPIVLNHVSPWPSSLRHAGDSTFKPHGRRHHDAASAGRSPPRVRTSPSPRSSSWLVNAGTASLPTSSTLLTALSHKVLLPAHPPPACSPVSLPARPPTHLCLPRRGEGGGEGGGQTRQGMDPQRSLLPGAAASLSGGVAGGAGAPPPQQTLRAAAVSLPCRSSFCCVFLVRGEDDGVLRQPCRCMGGEAVGGVAEGPAGWAGEGGGGGIVWGVPCAPR